jgi:hypothetical protein
LIFTIRSCPSDKRYTLSEPDSNTYHSSIESSIAFYSTNSNFRPDKFYKLPFEIDTFNTSLFYVGFFYSQTKAVTTIQSLFVNVFILYLQVGVERSIANASQYSNLTSLFALFVFLLCRLARCNSKVVDQIVNIFVVEVTKSQQ